MMDPFNEDSENPLEDISISLEIFQKMFERRIKSFENGLPSTVLENIDDNLCFWKNANNFCFTNVLM